MTQKSYYDLLGLSPDFTQDELRSAYRRLAKEHHPDKNPDDEESQIRFAELAHAYRVLKDPGSRLLYDRTGKSEPPKIAEEIQGVLLSAFQFALTKDDGDILANAKLFIDQGEGIIREQVAKIIMEKQKFMHKRDSIKTKSDTNVFHMLIDQEIKNRNVAMEEANHQLEVAKGCREALDQYESTEQKRLFSNTRITFQGGGYVDVSGMVEDSLRRAASQRYRKTPYFEEDE